VSPVSLTARPVDRPATSQAERPGPHRPSLPWGLLFVALLAATIVAVAEHGGVGLALLGGLGPDLALLAGIGSGLGRGQLHPRAVPLYNALHRVAGPAVVLALGAAGVLGAGWIVLGLGWATHVAMDRAAGYRLRTRDGWIR
jgi:hypothetical protein